LTRRNYAYLTLRYLILFLGFYVLSYGIVLSYRAELGVGPWTVLDIGIARNLGLTLGQASQLTGILVILAGFLLGIRPTLATFLNMFVIGEFIDVILSSPLCPSAPEAYSWRLGYLVAGSFLMGGGAALYISTNLGTGPRDGLMLGLTRLTSSSMGRVRVAMELTALTLGFFLGGPVGVGTVVSAFLVGPSMERTLRSLALFRDHPVLSNIFMIPGSTRIRPRRAHAG